MSSSVATHLREANAKALVPRAFELLARGDNLTSYADELFFLSVWRWLKWPKEEREIIERFCGAYLEVASEWSDGQYGLNDSESVLVTLAGLSYDWCQHFISWIDSGSARSIARLLWAVDSLHGGKVPVGGFWVPVPKARAQLTEIMLSPKTVAALETTVLADEGEPKLLSSLSALHGYLDAGAPGYFYEYSFHLLE